jgi:hypothetical protein
VNEKRLLHLSLYLLPPWWFLASSGDLATDPTGAFRGAEELGRID